MRRDEVSTSINLIGSDDKWELYTDDSKILTKMKNIGAVAYKTNEQSGYWFKIPYNQLSFRKPAKKRKSLTEEQKKIISDRMRK